MHVVVIGAGIIGLAAAERLLDEGHAVTLVERSPGGDRCSLGNAGGDAVTEIVPPLVGAIARKLPGWLADPLGPVHVRLAHLPRLVRWLTAFAKAGREAEAQRIAAALAWLNGQVYGDLDPLLARLGLAGDIHKVGALALYRDRRNFEADALEWRLRSEHGIVWREVGSAELQDREPDLGPGIGVAVHMPAWSHVADPARIVRALEQRVAARAVAIVAGRAVGFRRAADAVTSVQLEGNREIACDAAVVAAGAWSGALAAALGERVLLESERGYNATLAEPGVRVSHELIFAEQKFVATPLAIGLRIGGAAEFAELDAPANPRRSQALLALGRQWLPRLATEPAQHWMGHRPATPDSLPVISRSATVRNVVHAFGHGHLGLTQAATTARLVASLVDGVEPPHALADFSIRRFA